MQDLNNLSPEMVAQILDTMGLEIEEAQEALERQDWLLLDDNQAQGRVTREIGDSLWAFNPTFLAIATGLPKGVFEAMAANDLCEENNEALLMLVNQTCGLSVLVNEAINWDGRGHFLSPYDGEEHEISAEPGEESLYLYRLN